MFLIDLLIVILVALVLSAALSSLYYERRDLQLAGVWSLFAVLFLLLLSATWAGGIWITPFGPTIWGSYWLPFIVVGVLVALLLAALPPEPTLPVSEKTPPVSETSIALGLAFWVVIFFFLVAVAVRYLA